MAGLRGLQHFRSPVDRTTEDGLTVSLDYPVVPTPRYGYGQPAHPQLYSVISRGRDAYETLLRGFLALERDLLRIPLDSERPDEPYWHNGWFQGLDAIALYAMLVHANPPLLVEVGSGQSTRFARRAVSDHALRTRIVSIDPNPRAPIDRLCDEVIRAPLEQVDLSLFDRLQKDDFLFFDGSHRCFTNSDATVALTEVVPRIAAGVTVHVHDVFLPWDYPPQLNDRYYSEQYVLAAYLLSGGSCLHTVLPNFFICLEPELYSVLTPIWSRFTWSATPMNGVSFWLRTGEPAIPPSS